MVKNLLIGFLISSISFCSGFVTSSLFFKGGDKEDE